MTECTENINYNNRNNSVLSMNYNNVTCFGQMLNDNTCTENEITDHQNNVGKLNTNKYSLVDEDDEIPLITVKKPKEIQFPNNILKPQSYQRILPIQIIDIFLSKIVSRKPYLYRYKNEEYRTVLISGRIISKKKTKENKITVGVDDGTSCISCIVQNNPSIIHIQTKFNYLIEECNNYEQLTTEELFKFAEAKCDENKEAIFLNSIIKIFSHKGLKYLEQNPLIEDIKIGDKVTILGNVSDFNDHRLIFAETLKRQTDNSAYIHHMLNTLQKKL